MDFTGFNFERSRESLDFFCTILTRFSGARNKKSHMISIFSHKRLGDFLDSLVNSWVCWNSFEIPKEKIYLVHVFNEKILKKISRLWFNKANIFSGLCARERKKFNSLKTARIPRDLRLQTLRLGFGCFFFFRSEGKPPHDYTWGCQMQEYIFIVKKLMQ